MDRKQGLFVLMLSGTLFLGLSAAPESQGGNALEFIGKVINFIVLFGGLFFLLRKPLRNYLMSRSRMLKDAMKEAKKSRQESESKLQTARVRLDKLSEEIANIREEAEADGEQIKKRIMKEAEKKGTRLKHFASQEIDRLAQAGMQEIKRYTADLAAQLAHKKIQTRITEEDQAKFIDKSIERLEKLYE